MRIRHASGILLTVLFFSVAIIFFSDFQTNTESDIAKIFSSNFEITEKTESSVGGMHFTKFTANNGSVILKAEHASVNAVEARQYMDERRFGIESLYRSTPSPYPDVITRTIECPDEFKPIFNGTEKDDRGFFYYVMYANERFTYGACSDDLIKYRAIFYLVYCKQKNELYQIELFAQPEEFKEDWINALQSFKC